MKKNILFMIFVLAAASLSAQNKIGWKVNAGIGASEWYDSDSNRNSEKKNAYKVGVGMELPFTKVWSLQTGLNFVALNTKVDLDVDNEFFGNLNVHQFYLDLPVMAGARLRIQDGLNLLLKFGPYFAYGVGGKTKMEDLIDADTFSDVMVKRFDAGFAFGADLEIKKFIVGLEGRGGITKLFKNKDVHNIHAYLTVGYRF